MVNNLFTVFIYNLEIKYEELECDAYVYQRFQRFGKYYL